MMTDKVLISNLPVPESNSARLPLLVDICLQVSQIFVLVVAVATAIVSIMARAEILMVILRTAVALLAVGIPVYVLNFLIGRYYVKATLAKMEETLLEKQRNAQKRKEEELQSELDREA
jgi:hypothetical protein